MDLLGHAHILTGGRRADVDPKEEGVAAASVWAHGRGEALRVQAHGRREAGQESVPLAGLLRSLKWLFLEIRGASRGHP